MTLCLVHVAAAVFVSPWKVWAEFFGAELPRDVMPPGALYGQCEMGPVSLRECCDSRYGPRGQTTCWHGVFQFSTCCVKAPNLHEPIPGEEGVCSDQFDKQTQSYEDLFTRYPSVLIDKLGPGISLDTPKQYQRAAMQYLCCGHTLVFELQKEYCWPDIHTLWPSASRYRTADSEFTDALKSILFSPLSVNCCRGSLLTRIRKQIDPRQWQGLQMHLRTAARFQTSIWSNFENTSMQSVSGDMRVVSHLLASFGSGSCCCRLRVRRCRVLPFECPLRSHRRRVHVQSFAALMSLTYYRSLRMLGVLGFCLPDLELTLNWGDFLVDSVQHPTFSQAANFHSKNVLLLPDHKTLGGKVSWERWLRYAIEHTACPWERKESVLFWRGGDSAPDQPYCAAWLDVMTSRTYASAPHESTLGADIQGLPSCGAPIDDPRFGRQRAVSIQHPSVDAKFTKGEKASTNFATMYQQACKKWLFSLDGWANDFRTTFLPLTGSLLVRQKSPLRDWLDVIGFEAWKHYVPVRANFSDLSIVLSWLAENDLRAKQIAQAGHDFIVAWVHEDGAVEYLYRLLGLYAQLGQSSS